MTSLLQTERIFRTSRHRRSITSLKSEGACSRELGDSHMTLFSTNRIAPAVTAAEGLVLPTAASTAALTLPTHHISTRRDAEPEVLPADPKLTEKSTNKDVIDALPAIQFRVKTMPEENPGLNRNIVPQLIGLLKRKHDEIPIIATQILESIAKDMTPENQAAARAALLEYRKANTNLQHQEIIDRALKAIPEKKK